MKHMPKNITPAAVSRLPAQQLAKLLNPALPMPWTPNDAAAALNPAIAAQRDRILKSWQEAPAPAGRP